VAEDLEAVEDLEAEEDLEAVEDLGGDFGAVEDIEVVVVVAEDLLEELVLHAQLQDLEGALIHMGIIDRIADITDHGGGIIDLGITDGGIPPGGRGIIIDLGIIVRPMLVEVLYSSFCLH
jgi:hypothetical protein